MRWTTADADCKQGPLLYLGAFIFGDAIDAQDGFTVQRPQVKIVFLTMTLLLVATSLGLAAETPGAAVSGIVRDGQGVVQMGALVQVMSGGSGTTGSAFTDLHGRYVIDHLLPGKYQVKASAALFVPAMRANLQLRSGAQAVVNLTLNTLFDTAAWLPAERRKIDEPRDDWKWTLGSVANRPILRWSENGDVLRTSSRESETHRPSNQIHAAVVSGTGGFGEGGLHTSVAWNRALEDGAGVTMVANIGTHDGTSMGAPSTVVATRYERRMGFVGEARTVVSYQSHPELIGSNGSAGLQAIRLSSGQKMQLGDVAEVEVGGTVYVLRTSGVASASQPFLRVAVHPNAAWTIGYRMASARDLQAFDGLDAQQQELPVAIMYGGRLQTERGLHQEVAVGRKVGPGLIQVAYYQDSLDRVLVSGGGQMDSSNIAQLDGANSGGFLADTSTGNFRLMSDGYKTQGVNVTLTEPVTAKMWMALEYSTGAALAAKESGVMALPNAASDLSAQAGQSATVAMKGDLVRSGTRIRAAYRWQPTRLVTAIDPYAAFGDQAYLSCYLRQTIRMGHLMPPGLEATVDVTNLLAQGYRPFLSADGHTLFLAQSPRTIQAGLAFTF
jgi:hypothetical protein